MAIKLVKPSSNYRTIQSFLPALTAFAADTFIAPNNNATTPTAVAATAATLTVDGLLTRAISATDLPVITAVDLIRDENGVYDFDVGTGTADANDPGGLIDLTAAGTVNVTASAIGIVRVTQFVSGTKVRGRVVKWS
jgi:hypothetical protein